MSILSRLFRYDTSGKWHKGNTHIHSTVSDGGKDYSELGKLYAGAGYEFLFMTDHMACSSLGDISLSPVLWIDGVEIHGQDHENGNFHVVCLGRIQELTSETGFVDALRFAREQKVFSILAHPAWLGNTIADALRWDFDGVEIYNHLCRWLNGKDDGRVYWEAMLGHNPNVLAFCADDAHITSQHPGWNGGWIVINTKDWSEASVLSAIRSGNYYSSCGPEFRTIESDGQTVRITTSPVQFVRLIGPGRLGERLGGFNGEEFTRAVFSVPAQWKYLYLEIEDRNGRRAWTNTLFVNK